MKKKIEIIVLLFFILFNLSIKVHHLQTVYQNSIYLEQSMISSLNHQSQPIFTYAKKENLINQTQSINQVQLQLNQQFSSLYNQIFALIVVLFLIFIVTNSSENTAEIIAVK